MYSPINSHFNNHSLSIVLRLVLVLLFIPVTATATAPNNECSGDYKNGETPSKAELEKILSDHQVWYTENNIETKDQYKSLRANLCNANLSRVNLSGVNLTGVNLSGANLAGADLSDATISYANLSNSKLNHANLSNTDISFSTFTSANLSGANLSRANLQSATLLYSSLNYTDFSNANLHGADMSGSSMQSVQMPGADLTSAKLHGCDLRRSSFSGAHLHYADLSETKLSDADLSDANLSGTNLSGADLSGANLSNAVLDFTNLNNAKLLDVNLYNTQLQFILEPNKSWLTGIKNLHTVHFKKGRQTGITLLKTRFNQSGLRLLERQATYAIEKGKTNHSSSLFEKTFRRLFFEYPAGYGLYSERCLLILIFLIPVFALPYFFSVYDGRFSEVSEKRSTFKYKNKTKSGIYKVWDSNRIRQDIGTFRPELVNAGLMVSIQYALYFSLMSAFHIGWRDFNVGNWITRIQPDEYTLRATGWLRSVSGVQSLISVYLLALWLLTQFGRPFG